MQQVDKVAQANWRPDDVDLVHFRVRTTGILDQKITLKNQSQFDGRTHGPVACTYSDVRPGQCSASWTSEASVANVGNGYRSSAT